MSNINFSTYKKNVMYVSTYMIIELRTHRLTTLNPGQNIIVVPSKMLTGT